MIRVPRKSEGREKSGDWTETEPGRAEGEAAAKWDRICNLPGRYVRPREADTGRGVSVSRPISGFAGRVKSEVINEIARSREPVVITKRGRPLARVVPVQKSKTKATPGKLAGAFIFEKERKKQQ